MRTSLRFVAISFLLLLIFASFSLAATKNVEQEARKYVLKGEGASYYILNGSDGKTYYVVQIDEKNALVFNEKVEVVLSETQLATILKDYYKQSGATGFTDESRTELLGRFNESNVLFERCNTYFYDNVETNYYYAQWLCVGPGAGPVCDIVFARRAAWKTAWDAYAAKVDLLRAATTKEEIQSALAQIEETGKTAKNATVMFDDPNKGFAFLRYGATMKQDPKCGWDYSHLDKVLELSAPAMRNKITDVAAEAKELVRIYNERKDVAAIKEVQVEGKTLLEKAINVTSLVRFKFGPMDAKFKEVDDGYSKLKNVTTLESATTVLATMKTKYGELELLVSDPAGLLYTYNGTVSQVAAAKAGIDAAEQKYGANESRVISLRNEYVDLVKSLAILDQRLQNNTQIETTELTAISEKADNLRTRALNLPVKQNELDLTTIAAIVVLGATLIGIAIYVLKFRKKGGGEKEMSLKQVMGSNTERRLEKEPIDRDQHRKAMFPKV